MEENLSLFLAGRQKRLKYWRELFGSEDLEPHVAARFRERFTTYQKLIAEAVMAEGERLEEVSKELRDIEREMTSLFEARRLLTSDLGVGSVTDYSVRGTGGSVNK